MYIITNDMKYYPIVVYADELSDAKGKMKEMIDKHKTWGGLTTCKVAMSEIIEIQDVVPK